MTTLSEPMPRKLARLGATGLVGLGLTASAIAKLSGAAPIVDNFQKFHLAPYRVTIGVLELLCAILFLIPKTSSLGILLVTGYFGGAIVAHLTTGTPSEAAPAIVLGAIAWLSAYLRNPHLFESFSRE